MATSDSRTAGCEGDYARGGGVSGAVGRLGGVTSATRVVGPSARLVARAEGCDGVNSGAVHDAMDAQPPVPGGANGV